jgi:hypothetical protein
MLNNRSNGVAEFSPRRVGNVGARGACRRKVQNESLSITLLRVTLRAQPSDAAFAVHPLVDFSFAFETTNVNRLDTRTLGEDIPFALSNSHRFESYFCFGAMRYYGKNSN